MRNYYNMLRNVNTAIVRTLNFCSSHFGLLSMTVIMIPIHVNRNISKLKQFKKIDWNSLNTDSVLLYIFIYSQMIYSSAK